VLRAERLFFDCDLGGRVDEVLRAHRLLAQGVAREHEARAHLALKVGLVLVLMDLVAVDSDVLECSSVGSDAELHSVELSLMKSTELLVRVLKPRVYSVFACVGAEEDRDLRDRLVLDVLVEKLHAPHLVGR